MDKEDIILEIRFKILIFTIIGLFFMCFTKQDIIQFNDFLKGLINKIL